MMTGHSPGIGSDAVPATCPRGGYAHPELPWVFAPPQPLLVHRRAAQADGACGHAALGLQPVHCLDGGRLHGADLAPLPGARAAAIDPPYDAQWLLRAACVQAALCGPGVVVSLTLPSGTRANAGLVEHVVRTIRRSALNPAALQIGFGDTDLQTLGAEALLAMSALRDVGVGVALDVRAERAAYMLGRLPVTCLRLPPGLAAGLPHGRQARADAATIIGLAHDLDATVLALDVQTALQRDILADIGCDCAAGPVFGPVMPAHAFRSALLEPAS